MDFPAPQSERPEDIDRQLRRLDARLAKELGELDLFSDEKTAVARSRLLAVQSAAARLQAALMQTAGALENDSGNSADSTTG